MSGQQASSSGRADGRGPEEFRSICELLTVHRAWISLHARIAQLDRRPLTPLSMLPCTRAHTALHAVVTTKVISQAKGSAYAEFGTTKVMAGV